MVTSETNPVIQLAAKLFVVVEGGRCMVDAATDDPALDVEYRIAMRRAEAMARGLLGLRPTAPDGSLPPELRERK